MCMHCVLFTRRVQEPCSSVLVSAQRGSRGRDETRPRCRGSSADAVETIILETRLSRPVWAKWKRMRLLRAAANAIATRLPARFWSGYKSPLEKDPNEQKTRAFQTAANGVCLAVSLPHSSLNVSVVSRFQSSVTRMFMLMSGARVFGRGALRVWGGGWWKWK